MPPSRSARRQLLREEVMAGRLCEPLAGQDRLQSLNCHDSQSSMIICLDDGLFNVFLLFWSERTILVQSFRVVSRGLVQYLQTRGGRGSARPASGGGGGSGGGARAHRWEQLRRAARRAGGCFLLCGRGRRPGGCGGRARLPRRRRVPHLQTWSPATGEVSSTW